MTELAALTFFLDLVANALLSFVTAWLLIELLLLFTRSANLRLRTFLRLIPFLKLPVDLLRYDFNHWAVLCGLDPGLCEKGTRTLSATLGFSPFPSIDVGCSLDAGPTFSPMDFALFHIAHHTLLVKGLAAGFALCFLFILARRFARLTQESKQLGEMIERGVSFIPKIENEKLGVLLWQKRVSLLMTVETAVPFAAVYKRKNWIVFPESLLRKLSRDEIEAVIAHELGHIFWRDPLWQRGMHVIKSLFFWVPAFALVKRMQREREYACDRFAIRLGIASCALASALTKAARAALQEAPALAAPLSSRNCLQKRLEHLMQPRGKAAWTIVQSAVLAVLCSSIALGKLWIF